MPSDARERANFPFGGSHFPDLAADARLRKSLHTGPRILAMPSGCQETRQTYPHFGQACRRAADGISMRSKQFRQRTSLFLFSAVPIFAFPIRFAVEDDCIGGGGRFQRRGFSNGVFFRTRDAL